MGLGEQGMGKGPQVDNQPPLDAELPSLPLTGSKSRAGENDPRNRS